MPAIRKLSLMLLIAACLVGCHQLSLNPFKDKKQQRRKNVQAALRGNSGHSRLIGDYIRIADSTLGYIKVQGVGLVDRLDGAGEDPPASPYRTALLDNMRRREVREPEGYLRSLSTALVIVTAYIPPIVKHGDKIDIEVMVPEGSEVKSLAGGWLMPCHLREHALLDGQVHKGKDIALATGPILIDALNPDAETSLAGVRKGKIPEGGVYLGEDRLLTVGVGSDYRTVRMTVQIAERIGRRFHDYDKNGVQRPLAKAKSDAHLELIVHERYRDNWARYLQCIRHMALSETPVEKHIRLQELKEDIVFGPTAERAALQLEAIGPDAIPVLKQGLQSPDIEARFRAAEALAYLGNADGVPALKETADKEPSFRIFALAAMAALDDGSSAEALRSLMDHDSVETRYGAFRALSTMSPNNPNIAGAEMKGNFKLHPVDSRGGPLVHLTRKKKAEVVVFGAEQELLLPLTLRAGRRIVVHGSAANRQITVKRIAPGEADQVREVPPRLVEVLRAASELGATYPDIVQLLVQAEEQHNLAGHIAIDELPAPGRVYQRPEASLMRRTEGWSAQSTGGASVQVGSSGLVPNLFDDRDVKPEQVSAEPIPQKASSDPFLE